MSNNTRKPQLNIPAVSGSSVHTNLNLMHFKYYNDETIFNEDEMNEFRKNIDNYYVYTHFILKKYRGHLLHDLSFSNQSEDDINKKQVIEYYIDDKHMASSELKTHLPFDINIKYEINKLLMFMLL